VSALWNVENLSGYEMKPLPIEKKLPAELQILHSQSIKNIKPFLGLVLSIILAT